ncbi:MAG: FecR domain-containing protein [Candidatus Andeanibacterium colombiense]|uniref:FecR domain-containing protein n=1 Tax=Candidatus Andeanibacterium colombiense TaxID=3121345 RepID=A0AAJ6BNB1_9SPHN|nr:MAG: FecR domain-containing protein [Sphingomonadaceae bacterium]
MAMKIRWDDSEFEPTPAMLRRAARWQLRLRDDPAGTHRADYETWLALKPAHEFAAAEVAALGDAARLLAPEAGAPVAQLRPVRARRAVPALRIAAAAAALWFCAFTAVPWLSDLGAGAVTATGQSARYHLADGSAVTLNTDSRIDLAFSGTERRVALARGEAYFAVRKGDPRPFLVDAGEGHVRVTGTHFYVRRDADRVTVTVEEGHVRFSGGAGRNAGPALALGAGEQAFLTGHRLQRQANGDLFTAGAWRRGQMVFLDAPLGDVVAELNRYRGGRIWILSASLRQRNVSGLFKTGDTAEAIRTIEERLGIEAIHLPGGTVLFY